MARAGYSAQQAIEKVYENYDQLSVSKLIKKIRDDEKDGGHPELRSFRN